MSPAIGFCAEMTSTWTCIHVNRFRVLRVVPNELNKTHTRILTKMSRFLNPDTSRLWIYQVPFSPRLYRLIHTSSSRSPGEVRPRVRSVKARDTDPPLVCPPDHNHLQEIACYDIGRGTALNTLLLKKKSSCFSFTRNSALERQLFSNCKINVEKKRRFKRVRIPVDKSTLCIYVRSTIRERCPTRFFFFRFWSRFPDIFFCIR